MDIVERAAALLGTGTGTSRETARREQRNPDIVERLERGFGQRGWDPETGAMNACDEAQAARAPRTRPPAVALDHAWMRAQRIITPGERRTMMTESFRRVKRHIVANATMPNGPASKNLVMITSALPGEGKTFCSINLAMSLAMEVDRTVVLVDADFENPRIPAALGLKGDALRGFLDVVADPSVPLADVLLKTDIGKLTVLPSGTPHAHATELIAGDATGGLLREMAARYGDRIVIFDSAPLLAASESCALAAHMGQIVLVVEAGRTTEKVVKEALDCIPSCNVAGVLLNKAGPPRARGNYGYGYGIGE